jgi:elongator complex protein 3
MMPGLPGSSPEKDISDLKRLFEDDALKPDMLKVYPTLVMENTGLYKLLYSGKYRAYSDDELVDVIVEMKKVVPPYVRIMRIQREIEPSDIIAGPKSGNLRQIVLARLKKQGYKCRCIRCREAGLQKDTRFLYTQNDGRISDSDDDDDNNNNNNKISLTRMDYTASGGKEIFLSFESSADKTILGFLRLRELVNPHRNELQSAAVVRELHVYGQALGVGLDTDCSSYQHRGYGIKLMQEAERIAHEELDVKKIAVISAVGTREYYKTRLGYRQDGPYVSKVLS